MESNSLIRRLEMYAMVNAIETDLIGNYCGVLDINDIPSCLIDRSQDVDDKDDLQQVLRGLDLQAYIEISNKNALKLGLSLEEKKFINGALSEIITIRNKVMHPRLFNFFDYPKLREVFKQIPNILKSFVWKNVMNADKMIKEEPSKLRQYEKALKKSSNVIENLPTVVDFEDTSFIGRRKEIGEIKEKLFKKNVHILSVLGDGGVGKTALAIKLLYDLLDDEKNPFELILWVSLKTETLNNYEFEKITGAIQDINMMYGALDKFVGGDESPKQNLIDISKQYNTLLVLDNLETINTEEIRDFLDDFSENGKVLITSRIGIGEMEHRYFLKGLSDSDLQIYLDNLLELYNISNFLSVEEKKLYAKEQLHSNPLAIKWFVRGLAEGQTPQKLISNKDNLINFCMSNVYNKLSDFAKRIILMLHSIRMDITFAELVFLIGKDNYVEVETRRAINELCKCNFLDSEKMQINELLSITKFAQEFVKLNVVEDSEFSGGLKQKLKVLNAFSQTMLQQREKQPYSLQTFYFDTNDRRKLVATYYLCEAVKNMYQKNEELAFDYTNLAKSLCPSYFECNKVEAFFLRNTNPQKALEEYEIAKKNAKTDEERRLILINFKEFCLANNDYDSALESLDQAISIRDELFLQLEKVKIFACVGRFFEAEAILERYNNQDFSDIKDVNMFLTRRADVLRRKAENIKDNEQRFALLKKASELFVDAKDLDSDSLDFLSLILNEMMYMYFEKEVVEYIYGFLKNFRALFKCKGFKEMKRRFSSILFKIPEFEGRRDFIEMLIDYNSVIVELGEDEGIVYNLSDKFGFVKNKIYPQGIFFPLSEICYKVRLGDIVKIGEILLKTKGPVTKDLMFIKNIVDENCC